MAQLLRTTRHEGRRPRGFRRPISHVLLALWTSLAGEALAVEQTPNATVLFAITESNTQKSVPCRIHLSNEAAKPVLPHQFPSWKDHFVCPGEATLPLPPGRYTYEIERGPEYRPIRGEFELTANQAQKVSATLERLTDLAAQGWWSGDLHVHRPVKDIELLMCAEDLHVAPVITWWQNDAEFRVKTPPGDALRHFDGDRWSFVRAGEDERQGGALLFFHLDEPLTIKSPTMEYPPMTASLLAARQKPGAFIDIEKPFWWDMPLWLPTGKAHTIGLANNHMDRSRMEEDEAWGKPRDAKRLPPPNGVGYWTQELYYHVLNCGIRLAPSAGSASGVLPNPVGYNRAYVYLGSHFDYQKWWEELRAGHSFVTNGPLLRCRADGHLPGHIFRQPADGHLDIQLDAQLDGNDPVHTIELVQNGKVISHVPWNREKHAGSLGTVTFRASGWFLVRTIADNDKTFRFASTAPWYVDIGDKPFISRASVQFFLDWLAERRGQIHLKDSAQEAEVLQYFDPALTFWQQRLTAATAP